MNYLFAKIKLTWGEALYEAQFGEASQLSVVKRDWAKDLLAALNCPRYRIEVDEEYAFRAKSKIDTVFSEIRQQIDDRSTNWRFPDLRVICSYMANRISTAAHKPFEHDRALENKTAKEAARTAGERELAKMRAAIGLDRKRADA